MNFASFPYLAFLLLVVALYYVVPRKAKQPVLLLASYFFYGIFGLGFAILMLLTSTITFITAAACYRAVSEGKRRFFLWLGLGLDLLIFVLFKYVHIIDVDIMNWPDWSAQKLLIPIGISFYTFKTVGYCIDVYKRKYPPVGSFRQYALSVGFFPQLIAGPIEKSKVISEQLAADIPFEWQRLVDGGKLILWGLFKKLVIADSIAQIINPMYANIHAASGLDFVVLSFSFMYQIYTDFSGYSDIAIGSALCFGVSLPANFNKPFFSRNYRECWIRWHITFSKWLKEYIFDPMGGVVKGNRMRTVFNLWILFVVVGLWHGATINFMLYAQFAFVFILLDIVTKDARRKLFSALHISRNGVIQKLINYAAVMLMFSFLVVFFRPVSFADSAYMLEHVWSPHFKYLTGQRLIYIVVFIVLFEILQVFQETPVGHCFQGIRGFHWRVAAYLFVLFSIILCSSRPDVSFQYFQF